MTKPKEQPTADANQKKIVSEKNFSMTLTTYNDGSVALNNIVTAMNDFEMVGMLTIISNLIQSRYFKGAQSQKITTE